jgi:uncharacterized membrane protein
MDSDSLNKLDQIDRVILQLALKVARQRVTARPLTELYLPVALFERKLVPQGYSKEAIHAALRKLTIAGFVVGKSVGGVLIFISITDRLTTVLPPDPIESS